MKTEQDVILAIDALKEIIDRLMADLDHIEKRQKANHDNNEDLDILEYDIQHLSYQIAVKKERLKALEWVLDN